MPLHDLNEYLKLSAALNYQLSATTIGQEKLLYTITGNRELNEEHRALLLDVLGYLDRAYGRKRRRLGPMAVLHPLRAAALLVTAADGADILDLLAVLLHDKFEDIREEDHDAAEWVDLESRFSALLKRIDPTDEWYLMERLELLTRRSEGESYYSYIGRLVDRSHATPELARVKLADRLDNTLDMRIDFQDPLEGIDFFATIFNILFVPEYRGYQPAIKHPPTAPLNGARRMYELFKTVVTLTLMRQTHALGDDAVAHRLFDSLCKASINEAQRIVMHIFGYHCTEVSRQRELLLETMDYCFLGGVVSVTDPEEPNRLDGMFTRRFDHVERHVRNQRLEELYADKELMIEGALAFIVIFNSFLDDPDYYVRGVSASGIQPESSQAPASSRPSGSEEPPSSESVEGA